jgi:hypothetical protein
VYQLVYCITADCYYCLSSQFKKKERGRKRKIWQKKKEEEKEKRSWIVMQLKSFMFWQLATVDQYEETVF